MMCYALNHEMYAADATMSCVCHLRN